MFDAPLLPPVLEARRTPIERSDRLGSYALGDCDGDGRMDVVTGRGEIWRRREDGSYTQIAYSPLFNETAVDLSDIDRDGILDLVAIGSTPVFRRGLGHCTFGPGVVSNTATACGGRWPIVLTPADLNHDGLRDYSAACGDNPRSLGPVVLYMGRADGRFDAALPSHEGLIVPDPGNIPTFSTFVDDLDGDGLEDLALLADNRTAWFGWGRDASGTTFLRDGRVSSMLSGINAMAMVALDVDRDGRSDWFLAGDGNGDRLVRGGRGRSVLNEAPEQEMLADGSQSWSAVSGDLDLDGWDDVLLVRQVGDDTNPQEIAPSPPCIYLNSGDGLLVERVGAAGDISLRSKAAVCGDLDSEGVPRCLATDAQQIVELIPAMSRAGNWAGLKLHGTVSDPEGLGAWVELVGASPPMRKRVVAGAGTYTRQAFAPVVALGAARSARVRVTWPSGITQELDVEAGRYTDVREPAVFALRRDPSTGLFFIEVRPEAAGVRTADVRLPEGANWTTPLSALDGVWRGHFNAPAQPGEARIEVLLDGVALKVRPRLAAY